MRKADKKATRRQGRSHSTPPRQAGRQAAPAETEPRQVTHRLAVPVTVSWRELSPRDALMLIALIVLVVVSYFPATQAGFVGDDPILTDSQAVSDRAGLWQLWFSPGSTYTKKGNTGEMHYWPLVYTTFWLEHKLWGFAPAGYHVINLMLHLANTLLLWRLLLRLAVSGSWLVAAVFAVHPVHVDAVVPAMARKDLLSALFYLTAVLSWLRFDETRRPRHYVLTLALFVAGLLSKTVVVTLPAALLIGNWWKRGRVSGNDLWRLLTLFAVGLFAALADTAFYKARENVVFIDLSLIERPLIAVPALCFYVGKLLWPARLSVIYPHWDLDAGDPLAWGPVAAAGAVVAALWFFRDRLGRGPLAGVFFFAVTLSPVLGFIDFAFMQWSFVADRYQYLASIGVIAVFVGAAAHGAAGLPDVARRVALVLAGSALIGLGTATWRQAGIYRDTLTYYSHIVTLNPAAWKARNHLGVALYERGREEEALAAFLTAVKQNPNSANVNNNTGALLIHFDRLDEAETYIRRALELYPNHAGARDNLILLRNRRQ